MTDQADSIVIDTESTYEKLSRKFDHTFTDVRGGVELTYVTGEQVVSRLNEVLGVSGWSFRVLEHGIHTEADETWVLGELSADVDGVTIVRQQFGSDKIQRSRSTGAPLDIGFDLKSAATDAAKKCASLIGVGLYLSEKKPQPQRQAAQQQRPTPIAQQPAQRMAVQAPRIVCQQPTGVIGEAGKRELCGKSLEAVPERGWTVPQLANEGMTMCKRTLCFGHFEEQLRRHAS